MIISLCKGQNLCYTEPDKSFIFRECRLSRLLATRLKQNEFRASINAIRTKEGLVVPNPTIFNNVFKSFYCELYTSEVTADFSNSRAFIRN